MLFSADSSLDGRVCHGYISFVLARVCFPVALSNGQSNRQWSFSGYGDRDRPSPIFTLFDGLRSSRSGRLTYESDRGNRLGKRLPRPQLDFGVRNRPDRFPLCLRDHRGAPAPVVADPRGQLHHRSNVEVRRRLRGRSVRGRARLPLDRERDANRWASVLGPREGGRPIRDGIPKRGDRDHQQGTTASVTRATVYPLPRADPFLDFRSSVFSRHHRLWFLPRCQAVHLLYIGLATAGFCQAMIPPQPRPASPTLDNVHAPTV